MADENILQSATDRFNSGQYVYDFGGNGQNAVLGPKRVNGQTQFVTGAGIDCTGLVYRVTVTVHRINRTRTDAIHSDAAGLATDPITPHGAALRR